MLQVSRSVRLLLDAQCSIPVVGGLWRVRLQLPLQAVQWSDAQLQSVLLHELAHVRRRDLAILAITQVACALHWFNPLVWYAAWRLHAERERACDDLVLNSGVRPSSYAEHILSIVAQLRSTRWTQACGLAMARSAGLESRLHSVLNSGKNPLCRDHGRCVAVGSIESGGRRARVDAACCDGGEIQACRGCSADRTKR